MLSLFSHPKGSIWIASISAAIAGIIHLFPSALTHITPFPPLETVFFIALGISQLIWAFEFQKKDNEKKYRIGLLINGGAAILWILTRTLVAPFSTAPEHIGILDTSVLILELITIISLMAWHQAIKKNIAYVVTSSLLTALISGFLFYGGARSLEIVFPERESSHGHSENSDSHDSEEKEEDKDIESKTHENNKEDNHDDEDSHHD